MMLAVTVQKNKSQITSGSSTLCLPVRTTWPSLSHGGKDYMRAWISGGLIKCSWCNDQSQEPASLEEGAPCYWELGGGGSHGAETPEEWAPPGCAGNVKRSWKLEPFAVGVQNQQVNTKE